MKTLAALFLVSLVIVSQLRSQEHQHASNPVAIPLQPMAQHARQLAEALNYLGQPLTAAEQKRINDAIGMPDEAAAVPVGAN